MYVVIAAKAMHWLQILAIVHNQMEPSAIPPSYIRDCAVVWACDEGQGHTHRRPWPIYISLRLCLTRNVISHPAFSLKLQSITALLQVLISRG